MTEETAKWERDWCVE